MQRVILVVLIAAVSSLSMVDVASAAATNMPWESTLDQVLNSLAGPVLRALIIFAIIGAGVGMAFTEGGTVLRRALAAVFGLSIAAAAVSWGVTFFGFTGGAVF